MPSTRREALAAAATGLAFLAGCASSGSNSASRSVPGDRGDPLDYEYEKVRVADGPVPFEKQRPEDGDSDRPVEHSRYRESDLLVESSDLDSFEFAATSAGTALQSFAAETDFERESLYLEGVEIGECYERRLRSVWRQQDGDPEFEFCRGVRPADVQCREDETAYVAFAIRIALPIETVSGYGGGTGRCNRPDRPPAFDETISVGEESDEQ